MGTLLRTGPQSGPNVSCVAQHESAELAMATQFDIGGSWAMGPFHGYWRLVKEVAQLIAGRTTPRCGRA
jgi:hypothetical protein